MQSKTGTPETDTIDGPAAVARVACQVNEDRAIYPITPSSTMAALAHEGRAQGLTDVWATSPRGRKYSAMMWLRRTERSSHV